MSLEQLRAQAEAEDNEEKANEPEEVAEVEEDEESEQPEAAESEDGEEGDEQAEESEDFELELEGESTPSQQKQDPLEVMKFKLSRKNRQKKEAESEAEKLREELEQLKSMIKGNAQPAAPQAQSAAEPIFPDLYDKGIDGDRQRYDAAVKKYFADMQSYQARHKEAEQVQTQYRERMEDMTHSLAERAAKFATENKVKADVVAEALNKATSEIDQATGIDGALAFLLDSVGDGGERVAYHIGRNASAMSKIKGLLQQDPQGFKAIAEMTRMAGSLKPKHSKQISKAPEPDQPLRGDGSSGSTSKIKQKLQARLDKAKTGQEMQEVMREARKAKVSLDL